MKALERSWLLPTYGSNCLSEDLQHNHSILQEFLDWQIKTHVLSKFHLELVNPTGKTIQLYSNRCDSENTIYTLLANPILVSDWAVTLTSLGLDVTFVQKAVITSAANSEVSIALTFELSLKPEENRICIDSLQIDSKGTSLVADLFQNQIITLINERIPKRICLSLVGDIVSFEDSKQAQPSLGIGPEHATNSFTSQGYVFKDPSWHNTERHHAPLEKGQKRFVHVHIHPGASSISWAKTRTSTILKTMRITDVLSSQSTTKGSLVVLNGTIENKDRNVQFLIPLNSELPSNLFSELCRMKRFKCETAQDAL